MMTPRELGDVAVKARNLAQHRRDLAIECLPVRRQHDAAPDMAQEVQPRLLFERPHRERQRRLRDVQLVGRARDVLVAADRFEIRHLLDCHRTSLLLPV